MTNHRKKLIEVALPLEAINRESAKEKSIRHGHPATIHLWWARRPLAACRAVIFGQMVDDPSSVPEEFPTEESQTRERKRLFDIIERLVVWKNSNDEAVLHAARLEIARSVARGKRMPFDAKMRGDSLLRFLAENAPPILDPFCGGGSIPLEAQRLGLRAQASDLNPVPILINRALIEIPSTFGDKPPVNPGASNIDKKAGTQAKSKQDRMATSAWRGAQGLASDIRFYGRWMRDQAELQLGKQYPTIQVSGKQARVIAWLWSRTVTCPNPACKGEMPLMRSFVLSTKESRPAYVCPTVSGKSVSFRVSNTTDQPPGGTVNRLGATCLLCSTSVPFDYIRAEGRDGRMGKRLIAVVAEADKGRVYLDPTPEHERLGQQAGPEDAPDSDLPPQALGFRVQVYGMTKHRDLFTSRQLLALTTFAKLVKTVRAQVLKDALASGLSPGANLEAHGVGAEAYADAVSLYVAFAVSKSADYNSSLVVWSPGRDQAKSTFARQALPMVWDFAEVNPLAEAAGDPITSIDGIAEAVEALPRGNRGEVRQLDATRLDWPSGLVGCTDPPYYDNIGYADLSDFFYVWLRYSLESVLPQSTSTILTPKQPELVATPYRFGGSREKAARFFEHGLGQAFRQLVNRQEPGFPLAIYYAFKQSEEEEQDDDPEAGSLASSTGWETMLEGLLQNAMMVEGTWPVRSERLTRAVSIGTNALASSIVLVCRPRPAGASVATRQEFVKALKRDLPDSLKKLQQGNIAPVDLAQAAIGPGMAIFSRYAKVVESSGESMGVKTALQLINQELYSVMESQESEFDAETRWCVDWFKQRGFEAGPYGDAETLARAKNVSVEGLARLGMVASGQGKVRLLTPEDLITRLRERDGPNAEFDPESARPLTVWSMTHHLVRRLLESGEQGAADLYCKAPGVGEVAKDLAYSLYTVCERKGGDWGKSGQDYNALVSSMPEVAKLCQSKGRKGLEAFT
jgi:putative DNA methylase